jgi:hypothetical protein
MKRAFAIALVCVAALAWAAPSSAATITIYNTGIGTDGTLLTEPAADPHYTLTDPSGLTALVMTAGTPEDGDYLDPGPNSQWIGPSNGPGDSPVGDYTYQTTFTIEDGYDPATAYIAGRWASDNNIVSIVLNNVTNAALNPFSGPPWEDWSNFTLSSGFLPGLNTLQFVFNNAAGAEPNPTALRVEFDVKTVDAAASVPDGGVTMVMLGLTMAGLGVIRRRLGI